MASRERIGKYTVTGVLGRGAMGEVFLGEDPLVGRKVALKLMQGGDADAADRFLQEARVIGSFLHPNIVMLYEFGFEAGEPFLAMEYAEGQSFERWMHEPHALAEQLVVAEGMAAALAYAHARGVLHRDVKPSNVHVTPEGQAKLMDFGIARSSGAKLTATGTVLGTPMYMAPETLETAEYSERSDLYSLSVVLYEMWAGSNPFTAPSIATTLRNVLMIEPRDLAELRPDLPSEAARAVMACLRKSPSERLAGARALQDALAAARTGSPGTATLETTAVDRSAETSALRPESSRAVGPARAEARPRGSSEASAAPVAAASARLAGGPAMSRVAGGALLALAVAGGLWLLNRREAAPTGADQSTSIPSRSTQAAAPAPTPQAPGSSAEPSRAEAGVPARSPSGPGVTLPEPAAAPEARGSSRAAAHPPGSPTPLPFTTSAGPGPAASPLASVAPPVSTPQPTPEAPPARTVATPMVPAVSAASPMDATTAAQPELPVLVSLSPPSARRGASVRLEIRVDHLREGFKAVVLHGRRPAVGLSVSSLKSLDGGRAQVTVSIDGDASLGSYTLVFMDAAGRTSNGLGFEVTL